MMKINLILPLSQARSAAMAACLLFAFATPAQAITPEEFSTLLTQAGGGARSAGEQLQLARCYERGDGVEKNAVRAATWYSNAASYGSEEALKWLQTRNKAKPRKTVKLTEAQIEEKTTELVNLLAEYKMRRDRQLPGSKKALNVPIKEAAALLRSGANPNLAVKPLQGQNKTVTAMDLAAELGNPKLNDMLLAAGGTFMLDWRNSLLNIIYRSGVAERRLAGAGNNADSKRAAEAAIKQESVCLRYQLQREYDARMLDTNGNTLLHRASLMGSSRSIAILVAAGANVNQPNEPEQASDSSSAWIDRHARTPLFAAIDQGADDCVETLLRLGANAQYRDKQGMTPAAWAEQHLERCRTSNIPEEVRAKELKKRERIGQLLQGAGK